jgi:hypothetical protein
MTVRCGDDDATMIRMRVLRADPSRGRRAVALGLGVASAAQIELVTGDRASQRMADRIRRLL